MLIQYLLTPKVPSSATPASPPAVTNTIIKSNVTSVISNVTSIVNSTVKKNQTITPTPSPAIIKTLATKTTRSSYLKVSQPSILTTGQLKPGTLIIPLVVIGLILLFLLITFVISRKSNLRWIVIIKLMFCCQCDISKPENYINPPPEHKPKIEVEVKPNSNVVIIINEDDKKESDQKKHHVHKYSNDPVAIA